MLTYVLTKSNTALVVIKVITKLPNSEQSYKGKSPNCENRKDPDLVQAFLKKWQVIFFVLNIFYSQLNE
jgi:hypothetical protein